MERRTFLRNGLIVAGAIMLGSAGIYRVKNSEHENDDYMPAKIERISEGNGKRILVLMSVGTRQGNNDSYPAKETVLLMTAGDNGEKTFDQARSYWKVISGVLGDKSVAIYFAGGCKGCEADSRYISATHLDNAYNLGRQL